MSEQTKDQTAPDQATTRALSDTPAEAPSASLRVKTALVAGSSANPPKTLRVYDVGF